MSNLYTYQFFLFFLNIYWSGATGQGNIYSCHSLQTVLRVDFVPVFGLPKDIRTSLLRVAPYFVPILHRYFFMRGATGLVILFFKPIYVIYYHTHKTTILAIDYPDHWRKSINSCCTSISHLILWYHQYIQLYDYRFCLILSLSILYQARIDSPSTPSQPRKCFVQIKKHISIAPLIFRILLFQKESMIFISDNLFSIFPILKGKFGEK